jgi:hypothetical protein
MNGLECSTDNITAGPAIIPTYNYCAMPISDKKKIRRATW